MIKAVHQGETLVEVALGERRFGGDFARVSTRVLGVWPSRAKARLDL